MSWQGYGIIVRHGVTWWDSATRGPRVEGEKQPAERVTGWLDLPLRHQGVAEAMESAKFLSQYPIDMILSSPLSRTLLTARAIQQVHPTVPFSVHNELAAWNTGIFSGQLAKDVQPQLDDAVVHPDT